MDGPVSPQDVGRDQERAWPHTEPQEQQALELPEVLSTAWRYDYAQDDQETCEWTETRQPSDFASILPVPHSIRARILLLEGCSESTIAACCSQLGVPSEFFTRHESDNVRARPADTAISKHCLSAKWSRLVTQSPRHWEIESRIHSKTPYSVDTLKDPKVLRIDHERYHRVPGVFRPYCQISQTPERIQQHAARESISVFWIHDSPGLFALIVVDPKREHLIVDKKYRLWGAEREDSCTAEPCFLNETDCYARLKFFEELKKCEQNMLIDGFVHQIQTIIARIMVTNTNEVLKTLHDALDNIDLSLSQDDVLRRSLHIWREHFGLWRHDLSHSLISVKDILETFEQYRLCSICAPQPYSKTISEQQHQLTGLQQDLDDALSRLTSTFQSVMSTMSIIESQKAISQAKTVSNLTRLAFFFIPLSFIASIFGMNIVEFEHKLRIWIWITASASVTILTYGLLSLGTMITIVRSSPQFFQSLNLRRISAGAMRWNRILVRYAMISSLPLLFLVAVPVCVVMAIYEPQVFSPMYCMAVITVPLLLPWVLICAGLVMQWLSSK